MISLDWKERLKQDTLDFYKRKLPLKDYDIDIVYNAYPQRIDNKIPNAVITLVGKTLAGLLAKHAEDYLPFYDYLIENKGENGGIIFAYIMAKAINKNSQVFLVYLEKYLLAIEDQKMCNFIVDKTIYPLMKKTGLEHLDTISTWIKKDNPQLNLSLQKLLIKHISHNPEFCEPVYHKLETSWLYANENMVKLNSAILKEIFKHKPKFYYSVFHTYSHTRNPVFADILSGAICTYNKEIDQMVETWAASGNIKLKKIGLHAQKVLKKYKKSSKK